ncbi:hypothetical protein [Thermodesulforhabdus norvegica]|uniref:BNR repeat-like domain-containing protein n=1 Tax=Thermodesulforhabdus norvegica TaxID=39841 RepID=A0A1I4V006_9BACT|nr:hypothetical protein [Thermodesulforhabdus norvegica]SFM94542.1 hypothetical protein SAMN05660836_02068 [Thermodesulforhabdus norvegica]
MTGFHFKKAIFLVLLVALNFTPAHAERMKLEDPIEFGTVSGVIDRRPHIIQSREEQGKWFLAMWPDQSRFVVQSFEGKSPELLFETTLPEKAASGATGGIVETPEGVIAVWWVRDETGPEIEKRMMAGFIPHDRAEKPVTVRLSSKKGQPLPQVAVASSGNKAVVIWQDERARKYTLNASTSEDGGRTFLSEDFVVVPEEYNPGEPVLAVDAGGTFHLLFKGSRSGKFGIFHTSSEDGRKWEEPEMVASPKGWAPAYVSIAFLNTKPYVFWAGARGVHYAVKSESGGWKEAAVPDVPQNPVSRLEVRSTGSAIFVLTDFAKSKRKRGFIPEFGNRPSVYLIRMNQDEGWEKPIPIRHYPHDTTSAVYGDLYVSPDGKLIAVAWQDFRLVRSNIFINYSTDGGETWQKEDVNVSENPGCDNEFYPFLFADGKNLHLFWPEYPDDSLNATLVKLKYREVKLP